MQAVSMPEVIAQSIDATRFDLIKFQKFQMLLGYKADGTRIGKYKNRAYAAMKFRENPLAGIGYVDLRLEGYFQDDIFVDTRDNSVVLSSMDEKANSLMHKYGNNIFGLNDPTASEYSIMYLQPEGVNQIKNKVLR